MEREEVEEGRKGEEAKRGTEREFKREGERGYIGVCKAGGLWEGIKGGSEVLKGEGKRESGGVMELREGCGSNGHVASVLNRKREGRKGRREGWAHRTPYR